MGFWDDVNEELKNAVEEGWSVVKDSARIGKLRLAVHTLRKKADKKFSEIGGTVYEAAKRPFGNHNPPNPLTDPKVVKLMEEIKKIEAEVEALEEEIVKTKKKESGQTRPVK